MAYRATDFPFQIYLNPFKNISDSVLKIISLVFPFFTVKSLTL